jgi:hypothetical protein
MCIDHARHDDAAGSVDDNRVCRSLDVVADFLDQPIDNQDITVVQQLVAVIHRKNEAVLKECGS